MQTQPLKRGQLTALFAAATVLTAPILGIQVGLAQDGEREVEVEIQEEETPDTDRRERPDPGPAVAELVIQENGDVFNIRLPLNEKTRNSTIAELLAEMRDADPQGPDADHHALVEREAAFEDGPRMILRRERYRSAAPERYGIVPGPTEPAVPPVVPTPPSVLAREVSKRVPENVEIHEDIRAQGSGLGRYGIRQRVGDPNAVARYGPRVEQEIVARRQLEVVQGLQNADRARQQALREQVNAERDSMRELMEEMRQEMAEMRAAQEELRQRLESEISN